MTYSQVNSLFLRLVKAFSLLYIDDNSRKFILHNNNMWAKWVRKDAGSIVLTEFHDMNETVIAISYFLNILAKKHDATIKTFSSKKLYHHRAKRKIYQSFNTSGHVVTLLTKSQKLQRDELVRKHLPKIKTKQDLFDLKVLDIWIGIDIYETYLREFSKPTVYLRDPLMRETINRGIGVLVFWIDYFTNNDVKGVIVSHDCYLDLNILCKVAYQNEVPVYLPNCIGATYSQEPFSVHSNYSTYRARFGEMSETEQVNARYLAKQQLDKRLEGEVGVDMSYSTESAFKKNDGNRQVLHKSNNIKVLISSHCFYDNPHGLGGMLFLDFYEWLSFLGNISEQTDYDWYVKVHPDYLPGTMEIINEIFEKYPNVTIIPHTTSHKQLVSEGIDFVLTCYGTVGVEYPVMGKQVINAGFNPRISFDFNWNPVDIEEYSDYLLNLKSLDKKINLDEVYECYYMSNYYEMVDDLVFASYRKLSHELTPKQRAGTESFRYFIDGFSENHHKKTVDTYTNFINSGKKHLFSKGPEDD